MGGEWGQRMARIKKPKKKKKKPKDFQILGQNNSLPERSGQKRAAIIGKPEKVSQKRGLPQKGGQNWKARRGQPEMGKSNKKNIISDISTLASQS